MNRIFKKWDIWWARVPFEDDKTKNKVRPVLVMTDTYGNNQVYVLSYKITTNVSRQEKELSKNRLLGKGNIEEFKIKDNYTTGLPADISIIRITKKYKIEQVAFTDNTRIGFLSEKDRVRFKNQMREYKKIEKKKTDLLNNSIKITNTTEYGNTDHQSLTL